MGPHAFGRSLNAIHGRASCYRYSPRSLMWRCSLQGALRHDRWNIAFAQSPATLLGWVDIHDAKAARTSSARMGACKGECSRPRSLLRAEENLHCSIKRGDDQVARAVVHGKSSSTPLSSPDHAPLEDCHSRWRWADHRIRRGPFDGWIPLGRIAEGYDSDPIRSWSKRTASCGSTLRTSITPLSSDALLVPRCATAPSGSRSPVAGTVPPPVISMRIQGWGLVVHGPGKPCRGHCRTLSVRAVSGSMDFRTGLVRGFCR